MASICSTESMKTETAAPRYKWRKQTTGAFVLFHLLLPLATLPWLFSWSGVALVFLGNYIFCSIGIGLCYHRALCHGSLKLPKWLERTFAILGLCNLQDSPCHWVALHRLHHQHSDDEPDPHSPLKSFFWGHVGWLLMKRDDRSRSQVYKKYVPDLMSDPFYSFLEKHMIWFWIFVAHAFLFFAAGFLIGWAQAGAFAGGVQFGLSLLVWGVVVRVVYTWHITWAVNSVAHLWGYRNYETSDNSRNNWVIALATNGEGWHNNHHADQLSAAHGHQWWEVDITYLTIRLLERLQLARDVVRPRQQKTLENPSRAKSGARAA